MKPVLQCVSKRDWPALLQTVGEKLSQHVLANYEEFVSGVNEVASVERNLQVSTRNPASATGSLAAKLRLRALLCWL